MDMRTSRIDRQRGKAGICAILGAAGGLILGTVTATLSPGLVFRTATVAGLGTMPAAAQVMPGRTRTLPRLVLEGHAFDYHLARPAGLAGASPGVLLIPTARGIAGETIDLADRLASEGYVVFLPDRHGPEDRPVPAALLEALLDHLGRMPEVDGGRVTVVSLGSSGVGPGIGLPCPVLRLPEAAAAPGALAPGSSGWIDLISFLRNDN